MRLAFFLLVLANVAFFTWAQGYWGGQEEGREPQRLKEQIQPEKLTVTVPPAEPPAEPPPACKRITGLSAKDADTVRRQLQDGGFTTALLPGASETTYWVNIPALPNKAAADKKAGELRQLGVSEFQVMPLDSGMFAISLGLFRNESGANEFLQGLNRKGVKSARIDTRNKATGPALLEVRGPLDALAKRLPELLAATSAAAVTDCP